MIPLWDYSGVMILKGTVSSQVKLSKRHRMVEITASECVLGSIFVCSLKRIKTRHKRFGDTRIRCEM